MLKFALILLVQIFLQSESLYEGDNCTADNQSGLCIPLSQCKSVLTEVNRVGKPMPDYIKKKLQSLTCGFMGKDPMVCCVENIDNILGTPNRGGGPSNNPNNVGTGDDVDGAFTRRYEDDFIGGPKDVSRHPNLSLLPKDCGNVDSDRIFGGTETKLFEMPWMVLLSYSSPRGVRLSCGGTLINEWYVLTAAHCVMNLGKLQLNEVVIGEHNIRTDPDCETVEGVETCAPNVKNVGIASVKTHPGYAPNQLVDDIALIRLSEPADFSLDSVAPICLPSTTAVQRESLVNKFAVAAGWGLTEEGPQAPVLRSVDLPIMDKKSCQAAFKELSRIYDQQICAGAVKGKDSCGGDSGGPLIYPGVLGPRGAQYVQRGIVSYGPKRCGIGGLPGVYTNVAYYMDWILDNIHS